MNKIFNQAKDKNVAALIIYGKKGESAPAAYADAACTKKMKTSELKMLLLSVLSFRSEKIFLFRSHSQ